ncbi:MAG: hypothetical protein NTW28_37050 [Candidatus Solibacter sp.]|nr:hypothetical protein [Candidatus Solibacter sp.]
MAAAEKEMLPILKQIEESKPKDLERYEFALTQAIETTADSLELAEQDLGKRGAEVEQRQQQQKKAIEAQISSGAQARFAGIGSKYPLYFQLVQIAGKTFGASAGRSGIVSA